MLELARYLLTSEVAVVKNLSLATAEALLAKALAGAGLQLLPN